MKQLTALGILLVCLLSAVQAQEQGKPVWNGRSGNYEITWTTTEISGSSLGTVTFSARTLARENFQLTAKEARQNGEKLTGFERNFRVLSVVGTIVSLEDNFYANYASAAHPSGETRYTAIDLSKSGKVGYSNFLESLDMNLDAPGLTAKLTDYFPAAEIYKALMADTLVQKGLDGKRPKTLAELLKLFAEGAVEVADGKTCARFSEDLLTRFAFHHIEGDKVAVRLGLSGLGPCRENLTQLGLLLPIPDALRIALNFAGANKEGFLMKDLKRIANEQQSKITFSLK
jgi:hypothetical protein